MIKVINFAEIRPYKIREIALPYKKILPDIMKLSKGPKLPAVSRMFIFYLDSKKLDLLLTDARSAAPSFFHAAPFKNKITLLRFPSRQYRISTLETCGVVSV